MQFTYELDRRLQVRGLDMKSVACHPGASQSNLGNAGPEIAQSRPAWWLRFVYLGAQSSAMGALPEIYTALRRGRLTWPDPFELARRDDMMKALWRDSAALVGLPE